jgi:hypothetical protein
MNIHHGRGSRDRNRAIPQLPTEQTAAFQLLARKWREDWRAEKAASGPALKPSFAPPSRPTGSDPKHRADFAKAIARAEFGRAYWDERLQRSEVRTKRPSKSGRKRQE